MKFTSKLFLTWISIFLLFYLTIIFVFAVFWDVNFQVWHLLVAFVVAGVAPPAILTFLFSKRLDYMESADLEPPRFSGQKKAVFTFKPKRKRNVPENTDTFDEVLQRIDRQFIVSFSDRKNHVLKFRTDSRILSWGICGYLKMLDYNKFMVIVYSVNPESKREMILMNQTLRIIRSVFPH